MSRRGRANDAVWDLLEHAGVDPMTPLPRWTKDANGNWKDGDLVNALVDAVLDNYTDCIQAGV